MMINCDDNDDNDDDDGQVGEIEEMISTVDRNQDGKISYSEFRVGNSSPDVLTCYMPLHVLRILYTIYNYVDVLIRPLVSVSADCCF